MAPSPAELRVVAAVLHRDGRVLAAQRPAHKSQGGLWELPGGKVEPGEDDGTALRRELEEELGVTVEVTHLVDQAVHVYPEKTVRLVAWACVVVAGEPTPLEHQALRWLGPDQLPQVDWAPADLPLLAAVRALLTPHG
ncbi:(deoxy)nucleoside triphosphate pyrophosphohydrolase [Myxococcota bacterium]|nr:(deoxy)nucleoside triphosphate pyrophosphohydrolase [Myxococcota bacterium]